MKKIVIRAIWGRHDKSTRTTGRRFSVDEEIQKCLQNEKEIPFVVYGFGEDNCKQMEDLGFKVYMLDKNPSPFDLDNNHYRNKLEIWKHVMEVDGYNEMLYMDWDCRPRQKVPDNIWQILSNKKPFQANLQQYHRKKCWWRKVDQRKVPNGGFVYISDKELPSMFIKAWEKHPENSDEPAMAFVLDEIMGGWKGSDYYWDHFEPELCNLHKNSVYTKSKILSKNYCFVHTQG